MYIQQALRAILSNKMRSFLAMLGIIISVASVSIFIAIGEGMKAYVQKEFDALGSNNIFVSAGNMFDEGGGGGFEDTANALINSPFDLSSVRNLERLREYIKFVVPDNFQSDTISYQENEEKGTVLGTLPKAAEVFNLKSANGTFFDESDVKQQKNVAVLGSEIKEKLFGGVDPVGKKIALGNSRYTVVGYLEKKGSSMGANMDMYVYIPMTTYFKSYDTDVVLEMIVKTKDGVDIDAAKKEIENVLGKEIDEDEFSVYDQATVLEATNSVLSTLTLGVTGIAAISLLVGGIGIMNIMLVTVAERTREIGLRKALGATPNNILLQFLTESILISVFGGIIGLGIAFLFSLAIQPIFPAQLTWQAVVLATSVSLLSGVVFGAAPARRAANLSPIESLSYE